MQSNFAALRWLVLFSLALTFASSAPALTLDVPRLPVSGFADGETSGETVITSAAQRDMQMFRLELSFVADEGVKARFMRDGAIIMLR